MSDYPCQRCGACCRNAHLIPQSHREMFGLYLVNGRCPYLVGNECTIYDERPDMCRVDKMAEHLGHSKEVFYVMNKVNCKLNRIIDEKRK